MKRSRRIPVLALGAGLLIAAAVAVPQSQLSAQETPVVDVNKLIAELVDDSFDVRRAAKEKLVKLGRRAVPALTAAAQDALNDTNYSAVRVLSRMARDLSGEDAKAATAALRKIATGKDIIARQARESLEELEREARQPRRGRRGVRNFDFPGGGIEIIGGGGNQNFRSSQTSIVNGVVNTTVREPSRTVQIQRDPQGPVEVTVTEKDKQPQTWKANTVQELQKKHPEAHDILKKYSGTARRVAIPNMNDVFRMEMDDLMQDMMLPPIGMGQLGAVDPFRQRDPFEPFRRRRQPSQISKEVKDARLLVQDLADLTSSLKKKSAAPELQRMQEKLQALQRSLDRIQKQTGN